jgi:ribosome-associated toxin RatA of RatAB toxin-antitoxin module
MIGLGIVVVLSTLSAAAADDAARLGAGEILVTQRDVPGSDVPEATVRAVVDAPPEKVWAIVSDCGNYKTNMPNILESKQVSSTMTPEGEIRECRVVADLPFPFPDLVSHTRGVHTIEPGKRWQRTWKLLDGDYERNSGIWRVEPFGDDGKRSLVTYVLDAKPKVPLPSSIIKAISFGKLPEMIENVRKKVKA